MEVNPTHKNKILIIFRIKEIHIEYFHFLNCPLVDSISKQLHENTNFIHYITIDNILNLNKSIIIIIIVIMFYTLSLLFMFIDCYVCLKDTDSY